MPQLGQAPEPAEQSQEYLPAFNPEDEDRLPQPGQIPEPPEPFPELVLPPQPMCCQCEVCFPYDQPPNFLLEVELLRKANPAVSRIFSVPQNALFKDLHEAICASFDWKVEISNPWLSFTAVQGNPYLANRLGALPACLGFSKPDGSVKKGLRLLHYKGKLGNLHSSQVRSVWGDKHLRDKTVLYDHTQHYHFVLAIKFLGYDTTGNSEFSIVCSGGKGSASQIVGSDGKCPEKIASSWALDTQAHFERVTILASYLINRRRANPMSYHLSASAFRPVDEDSILGISRLTTSDIRAPRAWHFRGHDLSNLKDANDAPAPSDAWGSSSFIRDSSDQPFNPDDWCLGYIRDVDSALAKLDVWDSDSLIKEIKYEPVQPGVRDSTPLLKVITYGPTQPALRKPTSSIRNVKDKPARPIAWKDASFIRDVDFSPTQIGFWIPNNPIDPDDNAPVQPQPPLLPFMTGEPFFRDDYRW